MKKLTQIVGLAGVVFIALGVMVRVISQHLTPLVIVHLVVGGILGLIGIVANLPELKEGLLKRSLRMGPQAFVQGTALLIVLILVYLVVLKNNFTKDLTNRHLYSLTPVTLEVGHNLPGEVEIIAFFPGGKFDEARIRLELYKMTFPRIKKLLFVDPDKNEDIAREEGALFRDCVLFKYQQGDRTNKIFITNYEEADITNALIKVTRATNPKVWFTTGRGEPRLEQDDINGLSYLKGMLVAQGYTPESVDLETVEEIPPEVETLAIIGPTTFFPDPLLAKIASYINQGGNVLLLLDPVLEPATLTGLEVLTELYGIHFNFDVIFEPIKHLADDKLGLWMTITDLPDHDITQSMTQKRTVFYFSRSLDILSDPSGKLMGVPLARTSGESYRRVVDPEAVVKITTKEEFQRFLEEFLGKPRQPEEEGGPFDLLAAMEKRFEPPAWKIRTGEEKPRVARLVVGGTSTIARNKGFVIPYNSELVMNCFNWLAGEKDLKVIRAPLRGGNRIYLDENQKHMILYVSAMILPELFLVIGLAVWWRQR